MSEAVVQQVAVRAWYRSVEGGLLDQLMMSRSNGLSLRTVQRIWIAQRLQPYRVRTFKRCRAPRFVAKLADIVGVYLTPPCYAVVLSVDESWAAERTNQIQVLDCTQSGLPLKPDEAGIMTYDYVRYGTTSLFAAFNVLGRYPTGPELVGPVADGTESTAVPSTARHRREDFIHFMKRIERDVPAGKLVYFVLDTESTKPIRATHKHKTHAWLERHER